MSQRLRRTAALLAAGAVIALRSGGSSAVTWSGTRHGGSKSKGRSARSGWTFRAATCSIDLYWFLPPWLQRGPARAPCPWQHRFSLNVVTDFASRGHVFSAIGGYVAHRMHQLDRAVLADGRTWLHDAQNADGA